MKKVMKKSKKLGLLIVDFILITNNYDDDIMDITIQLKI